MLCRLREGVSQANLPDNKADRLLTSTDARQQTATFTYDPNGNLLTALGPAHTTPYQYQYDPRNRPNRLTDPLGRFQSASYDGNGNFVTSTDAKSQTATYVTDPFDRPRTIGFSDGSTLTFTFDDANRLTQLADTTAGTTNLAWDVYDRPTSIASPWGTISYQFDTLGRMEWIQLPSGTRSTYGYDAVNLTDAAFK